MTREEFIKILSSGIPRLEGKNIYIWGAGTDSVLYQEGFKRLAEEGVEIVGYGSENAEKLTVFCGKKVYTSDEIASDKEAVALLCVGNGKPLREAAELLKSKAIEFYLLDNYIIKSHGVELLNVYDSLCGERSKSVFAQVVYTRAAGGSFFDSVYSADKFFGVSTFAKNDINEVFVDCGAYVGNIVEDYLKRRCGVFSKVIMFEPDMGNFRAAKARKERLVKEWNLKQSDIETYPYFVGEKDETGLIEVFDNYHGIAVGGTANPDNNILADENINKTESKTVSLDTFFADKEYSLLKADVNGDEYKLLLGAKQSIQKNRPKIAVCISNSSVDMYSVPMLLKELVPEYKFAVRHHSYDEKDTILYAWCD